MIQIHTIRTFFIQIVLYQFVQQAARAKPEPRARSASCEGEARAASAQREPRGRSPSRENGIKITISKMRLYKFIRATYSREFNTEKHTISLIGHIVDPICSSIAFALWVLFDTGWLTLNAKCIKRGM